MSPWVNLPGESGHCSSPYPRSWIKQHPGHSHLSIPWDTALPDSTALTVWRHSPLGSFCSTRQPLCAAAARGLVSVLKEEKKPCLSTLLDHDPSRIMSSLTNRSLPTWIEVSYWLYKLWSIQPANNVSKGLSTLILDFLYLPIKSVNPKRNQPNPSDWKNWCWSWSSNILATWCKEPTHWERPWCWERLRAGGEGNDRGWDGWMASLTQWTWVWANSGSWWWTGRPGFL